MQTFMIVGAVILLAVLLFGLPIALGLFSKNFAEEMCGYIFNDQDLYIEAQHLLSKANIFYSLELSGPVIIGSARGSKYIRVRPEDNNKVIELFRARYAMEKVEFGMKIVSRV